MCTTLSSTASCQILSDFCSPEIPLYARSIYPTQLAKMSFDKILDLTAAVFLFYNIGKKQIILRKVLVRTSDLNRQQGKR